MTFDALLTRAHEPLRRHGRLPCQGLKRQFNLDDDALEDLRAAPKVGEVEAGTVELAEAD
jgi:hypothetical protein